jgi:hypothetical protein
MIDIDKITKESKTISKNNINIFITNLLLDTYKIL